MIKVHYYEFKKSHNIPTVFVYVWNILDYSLPLWFSNRKDLILYVGSLRRKGI